jgi:hypothetical protein
MPRQSLAMSMSLVAAVLAASLFCAEAVTALGQGMHLLQSRKLAQGIAAHTVRRCLQQLVFFAIFLYFCCFLYRLCCFLQLRTWSKSGSHTRVHHCLLCTLACLTRLCAPSRAAFPQFQEEIQREHQRAQMALAHPAATALRTAHARMLLPARGARPATSARACRKTSSAASLVPRVRSVRQLRQRAASQSVKLLCRAPATS